MSTKSAGLKSEANHLPLVHPLAIALQEHYTALQELYPDKYISCLTIMPKGKKTTLKQFHQRMLLMKIQSLTEYVGIVELSPAGVPHFHGFGIADRRRKAISAGKLTIYVNKYIRDTYAYSKYMVKNNPSLILVNKTPYKYDIKTKSLIPMEYTKKTINEWLNPNPTENKWT